MAFIKALRGHDVQIWVADNDPYAACLYLVPEDRRLIIPSDDSAKRVTTLLGICAEHQIHILVPLLESEMISLARAKDDFRALGTQLLLAPMSSLKTCLDRWNLAQLRSDFLPLPKNSPLC